MGFGPFLPKVLAQENRVFKEQSKRFVQKPSEKLDHQMSLLALELARDRYKELQRLASAKKSDG